MDFDYWNDRWREGRTGFHVATPNPNLVAFADVLHAPPARVLVPLCGKSHDLTWLADRGFDVVGVEFVAQAVDEYFANLGVTARDVDADGAGQGSVAGKEAGRVRILIGDFFAVTPELVGPVDHVYDRAALVAVEPKRRCEYVQHLSALTRTGGRLLLINFIHDIDGGPPFSVPESELLTEFTKYFAMEKRAEADILASDSRMRERGATHLLEQVWSGTRL